MSERGSYRSVKTVLLDGPDFQALPERARWVFVALKLALGPSGIEVHYPEALVHALAEQTGAPLDGVRDALDTLEDEGWIQRERNVVWVIGQLQHDPHISDGDAKHRKSITKHVAGLPRLAIVRAFVEHYPSYFVDISDPTKGLPRAIEGPSKGHRSTDKRIPRSEEGRGSTTTSSIDDGADAPPEEPAETSEPPPDATPDSPIPSEDNHWQGFDATNDDHWAALRTTLYQPLRTYVWKGKSPPDRVPPNWNIARELSIVRQWIRDGTIEADEAERFLVKAPQVCGWTGPGSLAWLNTDDAIGQVREVVGAVRKSGHGSRLDATEALQNITGSAA